ncbi:MAG: hypothetical protein IJX95_12065 [Lachnospiraceae bacterium]|nr:hypothetical protein [Lachnospiraceae bacterium]
MVDKKYVSRLRSVLTDTSYQPEEYLQAWYKAGGIRLSISNESMEQALQGYRRAEESGLKVAVSDTVQPGEDVLFYAQLNLVPEELLHRYIECGEVYELDALEAREYQFARITQDLIDATVKGMEKAEEIGISFSVDGTLDILTLMKVCGMICDEEDAIKFAMTCGDNVTDMGTLEFLGLLVENSGALDMCLKLKNLGTDVYIDDRSGEFVIRCLSQMERIPEEFLKMCAEEDIKLCILWEDILRYAVPESVYWEGISWEETMNWAEVVKNSKVSVDYSKGVSLQALIEFYQMMPKLPEWCLDLYGKNDWELSMSMVEQRIYADALNYMDEEIYEKAWNGYNKLQKHKVKVEYLDVWQPVELIVFYAAIDSLPEYVLKDYVKQGWKLILSDANLKKKYDTEIEAAGVTVYGEKLIEVISNNLSYIDNTVIHEMGHYVDLSDWENTWKCYSEDESGFKSLYRRIKKEEQGGKQWQADSGDMLRDLTRLYYRPYAFTDEGEFFAESYYFYIAYPEEMKETYPEVYAYIDKCSKTLQ